MSVDGSYFVFLGLFLTFIVGLILYISPINKEGFLPSLPDDRDTCFMAGGDWINGECMVVLPHPAFKDKKIQKKPDLNNSNSAASGSSVTPGSSPVSGSSVTPGSSPVSGSSVTPGSPFVHGSSVTPGSPFVTPGPPFVPGSSVTPGSVMPNCSPIYISLQDIPKSLNAPTKVTTNAVAAAGPVAQPPSVINFSPPSSTAPAATTTNTPPQTPGSAPVSTAPAVVQYIPPANTAPTPVS